MKLLVHLVKNGMDFQEKAETRSTRSTKDGQSMIVVPEEKTIAV
ncbi:unnamed protein product [Nezara viridula]|uniref:Uncharacterized protein n=1 Tax=Nezara viridula TaxID=85310 RepID=A0A9P0H2N1_NEZVI|nr:unnamed protein product [Nezara viridula]